jgi:hypothetical protein
MSGGISIKVEGPRVVLDIGAGRGASGASAYQAWLAAGNSGSVSDFIGDVNYQTWLSVGNVGTKADFLNSMKGAPGPGLNNRDQWVSGTTYTSSDYVFADDGNGGQAMYVARGVAGHTFVSTLPPKNDASNWNKLSAPQGPPGTTALTTDWGDGTATDKAPVVALVQSKLNGKADASALAGKLDGTTAAVIGKLGFNPIPRATFDAAPALILPANTPMLDISGKSVAGDYGDAAYRLVATEPSHPGKIQIGGSSGPWYELISDFARPDRFIRTGDTDDSASWNRARDWMVAKNVLAFQLESRPYDISSGQVSFNGIAAQIIGSGYTECGNVNGWNANMTAFGNAAKGTWVRAGATGFRALTFSGSNADARGARIDRLGFVQTHANPTAGWAPTNYDYLIENDNTFGGMTVGDVMFLGINKGIHCDQSGRLTLEYFKGQFYREGLYLDRALDSTFVPRMQIWTFNGLPDPVATWQAANAKVFRLFRCDGLFGGTGFALGVNTTLELNSNANGWPTDIHWSKLWSDVSQYGIYNNAAGGARVTILDFVGQCENYASHTGAALPNSYGYYGTSGSGGGLITLGNCRFQRFSGAGIYNASNTTVLVTGVTVADNHAGAKIFSAPGGKPIQISNPYYLVDDGTGSVGVRGTDYVLPSGDQTYYFSGFCDGSGVASFSHGLGANARTYLRDAFAIVKGNSGEAVAMTMGSMDGSGINFSSNAIYAGRAYRARLTVAPDIGASW